MSKKIGGEATCPRCGKAFQVDLYRSIWVEYPENMALILEDNINVIVCPYCNHRERINFPFLATNVRKKFALWYEPYHDTQIDQDVDQYRKHMGPNSFYALAPRIADWDEFKARLREMDAVGPVAGHVNLSSETQNNMRKFLDSLASGTKKKKKWWPF